MILNIPFEPEPGQQRNVAQLNANFDAIASWANGNVGADNLATDAVSTAKLVDQAVATAKVADGAITTAKLAANAVAKDKMGFGSLEVVGGYAARYVSFGTSSITITTGNTAANTGGYAHGLGRTPAFVFITSTTWTQGTFPGAALATYAYDATHFSVSGYSANYTGGMIVTFNFMAVG